MKIKALNAFDRCKYELGIFALLCIQALTNLLPFNGMSENFYVYYLVDFSMSKTSRLLIGSIVDMLTDKPTEKWVNTFALIVLFATLFLVSVVLGQVVKAAKSEVRPQLFVTILFFVTGSVTLVGFSRYFGMLDIYMFLFALLAVVFAQNRYLRWLVPLLCVAGVLVNYVFAISYFPLVILAVFYLMITQEKKAGSILLFILTAAVTVALVLYCAFWGHKTTSITYDELRQLVELKSGTEISEDSLLYYELYLFNAGDKSAGISGEYMLTRSPLQFLVELSQHILTNRVSKFGAISALMIFLFAASLLAAIWSRCIRNAETKGRKFVFLCFILFMLFIPLCCLLSTDFIRWIQAGITVQFGLMFFMFFTHDEAFEKTMIQLREFLKNKQIILWVVLAVHAFLINNGLGA